MKDWPTNILSNEHLDVRCCAHIVNLIVCDGLKEINVLVVKIRNAIKLHLKSMQKSCI